MDVEVLEGKAPARSSRKNRHVPDATAGERSDALAHPDLAPSAASTSLDSSSPASASSPSAQSSRADQQRAHGGDQRTPRTPPRLSTRVPQPHQLHRQKPARDWRVQTTTTPSTVKCQETGFGDESDITADDFPVGKEFYGDKVGDLSRPEKATSNAVAGEPPGKGGPGRGGRPVLHVVPSARRFRMR